MLSIIRAAAEGPSLFSPVIATRLMNYFQELRGMQETVKEEIPFPELRERELEVLRLIARGRKNNEIAQKLVISPKTIRDIITSTFSKLQVADRAQAIVMIRQAG
jgi:DNA-binding NarL/FixJ family response regulator